MNKDQSVKIEKQPTCPFCGEKLVGLDSGYECNNRECPTDNGYWLSPGALNCLKKLEEDASRHEANYLDMVECAGGLEYRLEIRRNAHKATLAVLAKLAELANRRLDTCRDMQSKLYEQTNRLRQPLINITNAVKAEINAPFTNTERLTKLIKQIETWSDLAIHSNPEISYFGYSAHIARAEDAEKELAACQTKLAECEAYEKQLEETAAILQEQLPIGEIRHIGRLEVSQGLKELCRIFTQPEETPATSQQYKCLTISQKLRLGYVLTHADYADLAELLEAVADLAAYDDLSLDAPDICQECAPKEPGAYVEARQRVGNVINQLARRR